MADLTAVPTYSKLTESDGFVHDSAWLQWFQKINTVTHSAAISGALLSGNNLSDVASFGIARANLGLGSGNKPEFAGLRLSELSPSAFVGTDSGKNLVSVTGSDILNLIGLGPTSSPTFAGLKLDSLNGILRGNFGVIGVINVGTSLVYDGSLLDAVQDIRTTAIPTFAGLILGGIRVPLEQLLAELGSGKRQKHAHEATFDHQAFLTDASLLRISENGRRMTQAHEAQVDHASFLTDSALLRVSGEGQRAKQAHEAQFDHSSLGSVSAQTILAAQIFS